MKQRGTYLVPTLLAGYTVESLALAKRLSPAVAAKALAIAPRMRTSFALALRAGVKIALGTDAGVMAHGTNAREFGLMVKYGITPAQPIQAGYHNGWHHGTASAVGWAPYAARTRALHAA